MPPATPRHRPGEPFPLGATWDEGGTNFSIFSEVATRVELCLFDEQGHQTIVELPERTAFCWHGYLRGVGPGQRYGFRVDGPWDPATGHRCNPAKLLMDPYAKAIAGDIRWDPAVFPYPLDGDDLQRDDRDSAPHMPRSIVIDDRFDWQGDPPLRRGLHETVIYEVHVKGFTKRHPRIPEHLRGTYAGLAHPVSIDYFKSLGITALELLPIHQFAHESHQIDKGLRNYWGYHSYGYFAPHGEYSSGGDTGEQVREFKGMVKLLHAAGLEVILDVVYNHTGEGNHLGPMLCLKGIDNRAYYRTVEGDERHYMDYTDTGNTLNMRHPHSLMLVMDSSRWRFRCLRDNSAPNGKCESIRPTARNRRALCRAEKPSTYPGVPSSSCRVRQSTLKTSTRHSLSLPHQSRVRPPARDRDRGASHPTAIRRSGSAPFSGWS